MKNNKIEELQSELSYEMYDGVTTRHMCDCNRKSCRRNRCVLCIQEEINKELLKNE